MQPLFRANVHLHSEQVLEVLLESDDVEQTSIRFPFDEQIQVALACRVAASDRTIDPNLPRAVASRQIEDSGTLLMAKIVQGHHMQLHFPQLHQVLPETGPGNPAAPLQSAARLARG